MKTCQQCTHYRGMANGYCTRPMFMQDGSTLSLPRLWQTERDERDPFWRKKGRNMADVCGKAGKWWSEK